MKHKKTFFIALLVVVSAVIIGNVPIAVDDLVVSNSQMIGDEVSIPVKVINDPSDWQKITLSVACAIGNEWPDRNLIAVFVKYYNSAQGSSISGNSAEMAQIIADDDAIKSINRSGGSSFHIGKILSATPIVIDNQASIM